MAQLRILEPIFHRSPPGSGRSVFERLTVDDYWEVGASGRVYDREFVLDVLEQRYAAPQDDPWEVSDFAARPLGADTWLVTYRLDQAGRLTRRATIWRQTTDGWAAVYHQGTLMPPGTSPAG
jgi:hypothetical protein